MKHKHYSERNGRVNETAEITVGNLVDTTVSEPVELKVSGVMDMLEQEFQVLTAIEQGKIIGGSGGTGSGGGGYGSGGPGDGTEVSVEYRLGWNDAHTLREPKISFDHGTSWGNCDVAFNPAALTVLDSATNTYTVDVTTGVGQDWYGNLGGGNLGSDTINTIESVIQDQEGGFKYTENSDDPPTYAGVTLDVFTGDGWASQFGLSADTKGLKKLNTDQLFQIYRDRWDNVAHADEYNTALGNEIFDLGITGPANAGKAIQEALNSLDPGYNVSVDGAIGSATVSAINDAVSRFGVNQVGQLFNEKMIDIFEQIGKKYPGKQQYVQGWKNRVNDYKWTSSSN